MARHTEKAGRSTTQTRRQRKLQPMPLTRKVEFLTQRSNWIQGYYNFITSSMDANNGSTFCCQLDLLMICKVNTVALLTRMHRMVNLPMEEGKTFHTFTSLAPVLNEILYLELTKIGPIENVIQSLNWSRFRETMI